MEVSHNKRWRLWVLIFSCLFALLILGFAVFGILNTFTLSRVPLDTDLLAVACFFLSLLAFAWVRKAALSAYRRDHPNLMLVRILAHLPVTISFAYLLPSFGLNVTPYDPNLQLLVGFFVGLGSGLLHSMLSVVGERIKTL